MFLIIGLAADTPRPGPAAPVQIWSRLPTRRPSHGASQCPAALRSDVGGLHRVASPVSFPFRRARRSERVRPAASLPHRLSSRILSCHGRTSPALRLVASVPPLLLLLLLAPALRQSVARHGAHEDGTRGRRARAPRPRREARRFPRERRAHTLAWGAAGTWSRASGAGGPPFSSASAATISASTSAAAPPKPAARSLRGVGLKSVVRASATEGPAPALPPPPPLPTTAGAVGMLART